MGGRNHFARPAPEIKREVGAWKRFGDDIDERILWIVFTVIFHLIGWVIQSPSVKAFFR